MSLYIAPLADPNSATDFILKMGELGVSQGDLAGRLAAEAASRQQAGQQFQQAQKAQARRDFESGQLDRMQIAAHAQESAANRLIAQQNADTERMRAIADMRGSGPFGASSPADAAINAGAGGGDLASGVLGQNFTVTGYHPYDVQNAAEAKMEGGTTTATGRPVFTLEDYKAGRAPYVTAAVDPATIALGTKFGSPAFPGVPFLADDTGGDIKGHHVDIATRSRDTASAITGHAPLSIFGNPAPSPAVSLDGPRQPSVADSVLSSGHPDPSDPFGMISSAVDHTRRALVGSGVSQREGNEILKEVAVRAATASMRPGVRPFTGTGFYDTQEEALADADALRQKGYAVSVTPNKKTGQWMVDSKAASDDATALKTQAEQRQELSTNLKDKQSQMHDLESQLATIEKSRDNSAGKNSIFLTTTGIFKGADGVERFGEHKVDAGNSVVATPAMKARFQRYLAMRQELEAVRGEHDTLSGQLGNLGKDSPGPSGAQPAPSATPAPTPAQSSAAGKVFQNFQEAEAAGGKPGDIVFLMDPSTGKPRRARLE